MLSEILPASAPGTPDKNTSNATLTLLNTIPEEEVWLASQKSRQTRRAYRSDVARFVRQFDIASAE
jgi:hypothetical protein